MSLTLAHQYLAQLDDATREAVFGNVGTMLTFQVGSSDAEVLAEQLAGDVAPQDLIALPKFTAYVRLLRDGSPSKPFSMQTLPPKRGSKQDRAAIVRKASRRQFSRERRRTEKDLAVV